MGHALGVGGVTRANPRLERLEPSELLLHEDGSFLAGVGTKGAMEAGVGVLRSLQAEPPGDGSEGQALPP